MKQFQKIIISIAVPLLIGSLGSFLTSGSVKTWYPTLNKPFFNPPNWLFAPVWTILFILIGLSFYFVWENNFGGKLTLCVLVYFAQLFFNLLWSFLFFYLKNPLLALVEILVLWLLILGNLIVFYRVEKKSGYFLIPYLLWVSFAALLNGAIVYLN